MYGEPQSQTDKLQETHTKDFRGRVVLVTGAGSGLARTICSYAARRGTTVVSSDLDVSRAEQTAELIYQAVGVAVAGQTDVTDSPAVEAVISGACSSP